MIFTELSFPGMAFEAVAQRLADLPGRVVVVSATVDAASMLRAVESGIAGYIPKHLDTASVLNACEKILHGKTYLPMAAERCGVLRPPEPPDRPRSPAQLTPRQQKVYALLIQGHTNTEIAATLSISVHTVRAHVAAILRQMEVPNRNRVIALHRSDRSTGIP